jgi:hypothetical protein
MIVWFTNPDPIIVPGRVFAPGQSFSVVDWSQPQPCTCRTCIVQKHPQPAYPQVSVLLPWEGGLFHFHRCKREDVKRLALVEETRIPAPIREPMLAVLAWTGQHGTHDFPNNLSRPHL